MRKIAGDAVGAHGLSRRTHAKTYQADTQK